TVLTREQDLEFRALYTSAHSAETTLEADVARRYRQLYPSPISPERYVPPADRSRRVVLFEMMTGSGCPPCVRADLALEAVLGRYTSDDVVALAYHEHVPMPDPMVVAGAKSRLDYY